MMQTINVELKTMALASSELAETVRKRGVISIDTDKLSERTVKALDTRLAKAIEAPVQRVENTLTGFEKRVGELGAARLADVVASAEEVCHEARHVGREIEHLSAKVSWTAAGRMFMALLPTTVMIIVLGSIVGGITQAVGLGPLLGWAWASFDSATAWWSKVLIALGALSGCIVFALLIASGGKKIYKFYRGW